MKRFLTLCIAILTVFSLLNLDAEARRFGGGSSMGKQRQSISPQPAPRAPVAAPAPLAPQSGASRWLGPLAGLAAGGLLASMFMGGGGGMGNLLLMLLAAGAVFMIIRMFKKPQPLPMPMQYAGMGNETVVAPPPSQPIGGGVAASATAGNHIPAGFDVAGFIHHAKVNFIRLQAANDAKNLQDIREFTSPEMYAEISMQINERDNTPQQTEVVSLNADLLDVSTEGPWHLASVRFSGMIRETLGAPAENFDEIWNLQKPVSGETGWVIAGIQQVH